MRILILGHSDSSGINLPRREAAWPWLVASRLEEELHDPVEIDHRELSPIRPGTPDFVASLVEETGPDILCLAVNPFWFAGSTVRVKVQRQFGPDFARRYLRLEAAFDRHTRSGAVRSRINRAARKVTRRVVGTAAPAPLETVQASYQGMLSRLSQFEDLPVLVLSGNRLPEWTAKNPPLRAAINGFLAAIEESARRHRFEWFDTESTFGDLPRNSQLFADRIHRNELGHQRHADSVFPVLLQLAQTHTSAVTR